MPLVALCQAWAPSNPEDTVDNVAQLYTDAWKLGVKAIAIYRDNGKVAQPPGGDRESDRGRRAAGEYGVPLEGTPRSSRTCVRFEPSGPTNDADIRIAKSIDDYVFRWMGKKFLTPDQQEE
jgi:hypothetical protein